MMNQNRDIQILKKMWGYCGDIQFTHAEYHHDYDTFCSNPTYRNAIALCLLQIGELVKKLSQDFLDIHSGIPWRAIRGMRNVVAHEYGNIDVETLWETAENGIIELQNFCKEQIELSESQDFNFGLTMQ